MSDKQTYRPIYMTQEQFNQPVSATIEHIRNQITAIRGQIGDLLEGTSWKHELEPVVGLLTCGLITLYSVRRDVTKAEIAKLDAERGPSLQFRPRGVGVDSVPCCFVCGDPSECQAGGALMANVAAFVENKASGHLIVSWFKDKARLDYRDFEPNWIQVKVGACTAHGEELKKLAEITALHGRIRERDIADIVEAATIMPPPPPVKPVEVGDRGQYGMGSL